MGAPTSRPWIGMAGDAHLAVTRPAPPDATAGRTGDDPRAREQGRRRLGIEEREHVGFVAAEQGGDGHTLIRIEPVEADHEEVPLPAQCAASGPKAGHQGPEGVERSHQNGSSESAPSAMGEFGESGEFFGVVGGFDLSLCEVSNDRKKLPNSRNSPA